MHYDPNLDRSEEFGWKKWSEDQRPSEEEQTRWSKISVFVAAKLGVVAFLSEV